LMPFLNTFKTSESNVFRVHMDKHRNWPVQDVKS
jgi:hypothetical protein